MWVTDRTRCGFEKCIDAIFYVLDGAYRQSQGLIPRTEYNVLLLDAGRGAWEVISGR